MSIRNGMPAVDLPKVTWRKNLRERPARGQLRRGRELPDGQVAVRNSAAPRWPAFTPAEWLPSSAAPGTVNSTSRRRAEAYGVLRPVTRRGKAAGGAEWVAPRPPLPPAIR